MGELIRIDVELAQRIVAIANGTQDLPASMPTQYVASLETRISATDDEALLIPQSDVVRIAHGFAEIENHDEARALVEELAHLTGTTDRFDTGAEQ